MVGKKVVVIGGGFGGATAARTARALLGREHDVALLDPNRRTYLCGALPLLIVGERESAGISRSLGSLLNRGVRYLQEEVKAVDVQSRTVATAGGKLDYDYLVLAPGAAYDWDAVPGAADAYSFYNLATARRLRRRLSTFRKGRIVIAVTSLPYKCPPAPFEAAFILDWSFKRRGVREDIQIDIFTPEPMPLAVAGPDAAARLVRDLERRGVQVHTNAGVSEVAPDGRSAAFSDGSSMDAELVITVPAHRVPPPFAGSGIGRGPGWIEASPSTLETRHPGVYAVGDVNTVPMANGRPLPKAGVFASSQGETVGRNIAAAIDGTAPVVFTGVGHCFIAYNGVQAGSVRGDFLADGAPDVTLRPPSARGGRAKQRFERDWRRFRI
jgi:sulfide:quinone oxidoreductase